MTAAELIAALADDQEMPRSRIDDIFNALTDLCTEELRAGRNFPLPGLGQFRRLNVPQRPVRFSLSADTVKRLGLVRKIHVEACTKCGQHPPVKNFTVCRGCRSEYEKHRRRKKRESKSK